MPIVRLTADVVAVARRDVGSTATTIAERAEQLGVGTTTLECALYGWTWRSVTDPDPLPLPPSAEIASPSARLSVRQVADMRRRYRAGTTTMGELARETGARSG